jgi:MFS family permease
MCGHVRRHLAWLAATFAILLAGAPALAGRLGQAPDEGISLWRVGAALLLCLVLAVAAALLLKGRGGPLPVALFVPLAKRRLKLVETLRLGPQTSLAVVACDGEELLVLSSDKGAEVIRTMAGEHAPAPTLAIRPA